MNQTTLTTTRTISQRRITAGYFAAFVILGLGSAVLGPTINELAANTGSTLRQISILFTARSLGFLLGAQLGGRLYDRLPGHAVMAGGLGLVAISLLLTPVVPLLWLLTAVMLLGGLAEAAIDAGGNTMLLWAYGKEAGPIMNGLHFFFGLGAFLSPIVVAQLLLLTDSILWGYWALALPVIPIMIYVARQPSPTIRRTEQANRSRRADLRLVLLASLFLLLYVGAEVSYGGWIFTYAASQSLMSETAASYLTSAFWGALTAGRLLSIPIARRYPPRVTLLAGLLGCLLSVGVWWAAPLSVTAVWLCTLGLGLFMSTIFPTTFAWAERVMPISGAVTGWFMTGASLGAMSIPWLIGQLFEAVSPQAMIAVIGAALLAQSLIYGLLVVTAGRMEAAQR